MVLESIPDRDDIEIIVSDDGLSDSIYEICDISFKL